MGDSAQIVAFTVEGTSALEHAAKLLAWLVERGVIEALPSDSGLGALAHRPGANVLDAVVSPPAKDKKNYFDFRTGRTNGMEVHASLRAKLVMGGGDEMPVFGCPSCENEIDADEVFPLVEELGNPFNPVPELKCPKCKKKAPIDGLVVENGAFATLTLRFWNWWPLKEPFVAELARVCGAKPVVLYERL